VDKGRSSQQVDSRLQQDVGEKRARLDEQERDLELCTMVLVEAQARGINPRDNHDELMEFIKL
jgi:hypothetical protein